MKQRYDKKLSTLVILHICFFISSLSGVCSKMAARQTDIKGFVLWYGAVLCIMVVYSIAWQQILKKMPLAVAYANKAVGLMWGMFWGSVLFKEKISWNMLLGGVIIFAGIYMVVTDDE